MKTSMSILYMNTFTATNEFENGLYLEYIAITKFLAWNLLSQFVL